METVAQTRLRIETIIKEKAPDIDLSPGSVLGELLTQYVAVAQNEQRNDVLAIEAAKVVKDVLDSATDTFSPTIDRLASNYDTYRNEGKNASGFVKVTVNRGRTYFIPEGFQFVQPNLNFTYATITDYTITPTSSPVTLKQDGETFFFIIPVEATAIGKEKQVSYGTRFALANPASIPEFVGATAASAFLQGEDKENDRELITRFRLGLSTKNMISPIAIESMLKDNYPGFRSVSVRGIGDPEDIRGANNPFGITVPGMVDVYVRMTDSLPTTTIQLTGSLITSGPNTGYWQIQIPADAVPGFYKVISIIRHGGSEAGTQTFRSVTYNYDDALYIKKNVVNSVQEARFTKYQAATVVFAYPSTNAIEVFDVTFLYQPSVADVQANFLDDAKRIPCADYLVKGIVPCNVSVKVRIVKKSALDTVDINAIKADIFKYVNGLTIGESISASKIVDICHNYDIKRVDLPVILKGSVIAPFSSTDSTIYISGTDTLVIPNNSSVGVTPYTTAFFINYFDENGNEAISVETA
jgi:hypothetical protein